MPSTISMFTGGISADTNNVFFQGNSVIMNVHSPPGTLGVFSPESMSASSSDNSQESTMTNHSSPSNMGHYATIELQDLLMLQRNNEGPCLVIREEPVDRFRFRYKSEMIGTHGSILGRNSEKMRKKSYPTVELCNYNGSAIIRCTLCTFSPKGLPRSLHTHRLVIRQGNEDKDDPHDIVVSPDNGYIAVFQGMGIIHTAKKNIVDELIKKNRAHRLERIRCQNPTLNRLSVRDECNIRKDAEVEARKMNLNSVSLCFEAFRQDENGRMVELCNPVYSCVINNMKSALTGELKICRIDRHTSSCYGGDEIFILVEKVGKKNLKIKFFELDDEENEVWCDYGRFSELDVHHQYAVVFRTPPYRDTNIDHVVDVFVQLLRPSDGDCSEPVRFQYKPSEKSGRKRHRMSEDSLPLEVQILNNTGINNLVNNLSLENTTYLPPAQGRTLYIDPEEVMMHHNSNPKLPHIDDTVPELFHEVFNDGEALTSSEFKEYIKNLSFPSGSLSEYISTLDPSELDGSKSEDMDLTTDSARGTSSFKIPSDTLKKGILSVRELLMTKEGGKQGVSREKRMTNKVPNKVHLSDTPKTVVNKLTEMLKERPPPKIVAKMVKVLFHDRSAEGYSPLHLAILMNLKDSLKFMLSVLGKGRHSDIINARDNNKETALHLSVKQNDQNFVSMLLHVGAEVNIPNKAGDTPFHLAVSLGHTQCLEELLESSNYQLGQPQPKLNKKNENGETALHIAAHRMNLEAVNLLCRAGADVNETTLHQGDTVLHIAVNEECMPIIKYIVEKTKIEIDHPNLAGNTALHMSCVVGGKGSVEICRFLMHNKANPYKANYIIERQRMKEQEGTKLKGESVLVVVKQEPDSEPEDERTPVALMLSEGASSTVNSELRMSTEERNGDMEDSEEGSEGDEDSEDDDELVDFHGQTSFDLASNNEDILKLLRKLDQRMEEVEAPTLVVKEEKEEELTTEEEDPNVKLTDETLERLSEILNKSGGWKKLAEMLDYAFLVRNINNASNPSKMLFTYAEQVHGNLSVWNLRGYLDIMGENEAVEVIDNMLAQHYVSTSDHV